MSHTASKSATKKGSRYSLGGKVCSSNTTFIQSKKRRVPGKWLADSELSAAVDAIESARLFTCCLSCQQLLQQNNCNVFHNIHRCQPRVTGCHERAVTQLLVAQELAAGANRARHRRAGGYADDVQLVVATVLLQCRHISRCQEQDESHAHMHARRLRAPRVGHEAVHTTPLQTCAPAQQLDGKSMAREGCRHAYCTAGSNSLARLQHRFHHPPRHWILQRPTTCSHHTCPTAAMHTRRGAGCPSL